MFGRLKGSLKRLYYRRILPSMALRVKSSGLTYLSYEKLASLSRLLRQVRADNVEGDFVEFGVALGGAAILIASELSKGQAFYGYDVFEMIPPPGVHDDKRSQDRYRVISSGKAVGPKGRPYYGYIDNLYEVVCDNFRSCGHPVDANRIVLRKGLFEQSLPLDADRKIAFAHVDCDWYEPVRYCLAETSKRISGRGVIVLDDYNDYGGCRMAVDEFLSHNPQFHVLYLQPHAVIQRS